jgi:phage terminase large subunit GpA-like protein
MNVQELVKEIKRGWKPPPLLSLSEWAEEHFYLSAESAAESGRWKCYPFQRGIMDAITDPRTEKVSVIKSARVGYTKIVNATIGYHIHQDPCSMLVVQPTVEDAKGYSKEEIAPMLRDCPALTEIVHDDPDADNGPKDSGNTILHKKFPGGVLSMVGANSGAGFRRISRRVVIFDEVDGYPPSAGSDGDQIKLGTKRAEYFWNRKILAGSTPLVAGRSRIETLFNEGDQRRFYVPCPHCGHMAPLVFRGDGGHAMAWDEDKPETAHFVCQKNGCVIEHSEKVAMVSGGEWRASQPFKGHASFHVWTAYSFAPQASWSTIADEFLKANRDGVEALKTFVNTWLGETWRERGDAPDHERLWNRREDYPMGSVPDGVLVLTAGVDVQKDRWVYEVVGWGYGKESWSIDAGVIQGDPSNEVDWMKLDALLNRTFATSTGAQMVIRMLAVDSGWNTQVVYNWARTHPRDRVMATKGVKTQRSLLGAPSPVDVKVNGKRMARGYKVWPVGVDIAKSELYGWLKLGTPEDGKLPPGFCHFPEYGLDFFKQLTAEQLVTVVDKRGYQNSEWQVIPGRENHWLDARVYARAAAAALGLDRLQAPAPDAPPPAPESTSVTAPPPVQTPQQQSRPGFLQGIRTQGRQGGWLGRRR